MNKQTKTVSACIRCARPLVVTFIFPGSEMRGLKKCRKCGDDVQGAYIAVEGEPECVLRTRKNDLQSTSVVSVS